ncbi:MAG: translation initiation factor IF-2 associated domain-containing protein, partial [Sphingobium sp.]|nr:translation initiation factor IF-2 associated domain-containing protein [Sphingobium sp.]
MSDSKEDKPVLGRKPLGIKRTVESGQVQQQFSHGRKNTVVVEVKRRRILGKPGEGGAPVAPQPDPVPAAAT